MSGQVWITNSLGGFGATPRLSKSLRYVSRPLYAFRQFAKPASAYGAHMGDYHYFNKLKRLTSSGGTLVETNTMPETNFVWIQDSVQVTEYGRQICRYIINLFKGVLCA